MFVGVKKGLFCCRRLKKRLKTVGIFLFLFLTSYILFLRRTTTTTALNTFNNGIIYILEGIIYNGMVVGKGVCPLLLFKALYISHSKNA